MPAEQSSIMVGAKKALGFNDGTYANITENIAGVAAIAVPALAAGVYLASSSLKRSIPEANKAVYSEARKGAPGILRIAMPS